MEVDFGTDVHASREDYECEYECGFRTGGFRELLEHEEKCESRRLGGVNGDTASEVHSQDGRAESPSGESVRLTLETAKGAQYAKLISANMRQLEAELGDAVSASCNLTSVVRAEADAAADARRKAREQKRHSEEIERAGQEPRKSARIAELNGVAASTSQGGRHAREPGATASGSGCSTSRTSAQQNMQDDMLVEEFLAKTRTKRLDVLPDGNCFFYSTLLSQDVSTPEEANPSPPATISAKTAGNVARLRQLARDHVTDHVVDATDPLAGPYGQLILRVFSENLIKTLEEVREEVKGGLQQLVRDGEYIYQPAKYVFRFMMWAVACLLKKPIVSLSFNNSDTLFKHFEVYGDPKMGAYAPFRHLPASKVPELRNFDFTALDLSEYVMLLFRNNHFWCIKTDPSTPPVRTSGMAGRSHRVCAELAPLDEHARDPTRSIEGAVTLPGAKPAEQPRQQLVMVPAASAAVAFRGVGAEVPQALDLQVSAGTGNSDSNRSQHVTASAKAAGPARHQLGETSIALAEREKKQLMYIANMATRTLNIDIGHIAINRFGPFFPCICVHVWSHDCAAAVPSLLAPTSCG
jgi:hypothetical protein